MKVTFYISKILNIALVLFVFFAFYWCEKNPEQVGKWYGKFEKGMLIEFKKR